MKLSVAVDMIDYDIFLETLSFDFQNIKSASFSPTSNTLILLNQCIQTSFEPSMLSPVTFLRLLTFDAIINLYITKRLCLFKTCPYIADL